MKIKSYIVWDKKDPSWWYTVEAPSKRIAKWCGANIVMNHCCCQRTARDMGVKEDN